MKQCQTCKFWVGYVGGHTPGECRIKAPRMRGEVERDIPVGGEPRSGVWPKTWASDGCAEQEED